MLYFGLLSTWPLDNQVDHKTLRKLRSNPPHALYKPFQCLQPHCLAQLPSAPQGSPSACSSVRPLLRCPIRQVPCCVPRLDLSPTALTPHCIHSQRKFLPIVTRPYSDVSYKNSTLIFGEVFLEYLKIKQTDSTYALHSAQASSVPSLLPPTPGLPGTLLRDGNAPRLCARTRATCALEGSWDARGSFNSVDFNGCHLGMCLPFSVFTVSFCISARPQGTTFFFLSSSGVS